MARLVGIVWAVLQLVHPILSRFAVPPIPEKEQPINPDIKRLQPTPSYEKHRVVVSVLFPSSAGHDLPGGRSHPGGQEEDASVVRSLEDRPYVLIGAFSPSDPPPVA